MSGSKSPRVLIVDIVSELIVDDPVKYSEKIPVFRKITLMNTKCEFVGLDIQDDMGRHEVGFQDNTEKIPMYDDNGCRMETHFLINKVPGNFHVSTHSAKSQPTAGDMRHVVHKLRFGMDLEAGKDVKGSFNPMESLDKAGGNGKEVRGSFNPMESLDKAGGNAQATHDYIVRVVPSVYVSMNGNKRFPYQYTYSYREKLIANKNPAVWFKYQLSPITVQYREMRKPLYHFLTTVCAIIGGTFTVAGILDSCIFTAHEIIKKIEIGKQS
ncbi:endoplasmic reticulum-Golgi intermediate compartment protein 1-like [Dreissena polymorpha]|uniref:endoplasmic reticulum-Golgi intermediate compartment protein 1-like n=1 Tax=Dreissena polymorpha TaxID=45954 RepID=UPI0022642F73|nr:endoplasmic reticulum-Golgi intermediate compartment protein 1-like [Dreissena polymorpha]